VSSDGLVSGLLLGSCQLTARALGNTPAGEVIEYSRDTVDVHVVYLTSIRYPYTSNCDRVAAGFLAAGIESRSTGLRAVFRIRDILFRIRILKFAKITCY
jgi:hypothetical protein